MTHNLSIAPVLGYLLLFLFASLPFFILFALVFIALTFVPTLDGRPKLTALIAAGSSLAVNLAVILLSRTDPISYAAVIVGWLISKLPLAIILGAVAALPNLKKLIEGEDSVSRKPRLIVFCTMLGALAIGAAIDALSDFTVAIGERSFTPIQITASVILGSVTLIPYISVSLLLALVIYVIMRLLRKKHDPIGTVIPLISALLVTAAASAVLAANPIVEIPPEYEAFVEADELAELKSLLPGAFPRFKYKIEIKSATESSVDAWFYYISRSYRTSCRITRTEDGFSPIFESEPCMNPFGW